MSVIPLKKPDAPNGQTAPSDASLVAAALAGDNRAAGQLYRRHAGAIYSSLLRIFRQPADAEDALHDAFVLALDKLGQLQDSSQFRAWVMRSAVRIVYRKGRRRKWLEAFTRSAKAEAPVTVAGPDAKAELKKVFEVLATLPEKERVAWVLRYVEGYTLPEAALACDCSLATVKRRIRAAAEVVGQHVDVREPVETAPTPIPPNRASGEEVQR